MAVEVKGYLTKIIKNIGTFKTLQYFLNNCFFEIQVLKLKNTPTGYDAILFIANSCFILIKPYYALVDLGMLFTLKMVLLLKTRVVNFRGSIMKCTQKDSN